MMKHYPKLVSPDLKQQMDEWNRLREQDKWLVVAYRGRTKIKGDVLRIDGAHVDKTGSLIVVLEVQKIARASGIGEWLECGKLLEMKPSEMLWYTVVDDFDMFEGVSAFRNARKQAEHESLKLR